MFGTGPRIGEPREFWKYATASEPITTCEAIAVGSGKNMGREIFGPAGDNAWNLQLLKDATMNFVHANMGIHARAALKELSNAYRFELIVAAPGRQDAGHFRFWSGCTGPIFTLLDATHELTLRFNPFGYIVLGTKLAIGGAISFFALLPSA
jgi:hypothetical protein